MSASLCSLLIGAPDCTAAANTPPGRAPTAISELESLHNADTFLSAVFTSGTLSAVSMAKPGPKPVSDLTFVVVGSGRLHWA